MSVNVQLRELSLTFSYKKNQGLRPVRIKSFRRSPTKKERNGEKERGEVAL